MSELKDFIRTEFTKAGYQLLTNDLWTNDCKTDFWLVYNVDDCFHLEDFQDQLLEQCSGLFAQYRSMEKNTSLLILNRVQRSDLKHIEQVVSDENNPYDFKKYIIQYTLDEWEQAKTYLKDSLSLSSVLMNPDVFKQLKNDVPNSAIALLYAIAHKLPFVMMPVQQKEFDFKNELYYKDSKELELDNWLDSIQSENNLGDKIDEYINSIDHE